MGMVYFGYKVKVFLLFTQTFGRILAISLTKELAG